MAKGSKQTIQKKQTKEKRQKAAKATAAAAPEGSTGMGHNTDEQNRALFLHHLTNDRNGITKLKGALNTANANLRNGYKAAKADGFEKKDFEIAFEIQQADGEKKRKAAIQRSLQIAKWLGCDLGSQLDLFAQEERVPAEDHAYEAGKTASYEGKSASPPYDPSLAQARRWLEGWHDATETRVKSGISKLHPEVAASEKAAAAKKGKIEGQKAADAKEFEAPSSGVAMTRADFEKQKQAEAQGGDLH